MKIYFRYEVESDKVHHFENIFKLIEYIIDNGESVVKCYKRNDDDKWDLKVKTFLSVTFNDKFILTDVIEDGEHRLIEVHKSSAPEYLLKKQHENI